VKDLSGGQKRRLQLLLILLDQPNVLILDEPTNDLDTDMLAAIEDLLDSWPGTLVVVSHDRYLIERVTDQQFAILDGHLRHLPGGVDEYLRLRRAQQATDASAGAPAAAARPGAAASDGQQGAAPAAAQTGLTGAERRSAEKEVASLDRRLAKLQGEIAAAHDRLAAHDQSDYLGLGTLTDELRALEAQQAELETRWLELSEQLEE
jgi:ABC-type multidrug transport system ATPase subunit